MAARRLQQWQFILDAVQHIQHVQFQFQFQFQRQCQPLG
jgi:hypothetical protein